MHTINQFPRWLATHKIREPPSELVTQTERHPRKDVIKIDEDASKTLEIDKSLSELHRKIHSTLSVNIFSTTSPEKSTTQI